MILVDTSVLVHYLRTASPAIREIFIAMDCAVCGVVRAEILHGARTPEDANQLRQALDGFRQLPLAENTWDQFGEHLSRLRSVGLAAPFQDVLLASIAINHDAEFWSYDMHFQLIQRVLPNLRLFSGPSR